MPTDDPKQRAAEIEAAIAANRKKEADADQSGDTLNKLVARLDDFLGKMAALSGRLDAVEADAKKRDDKQRDDKKRDDARRKDRKDDEEVRSPMSGGKRDDDDPDPMAEQPNKEMNLAKEVVADSRADAARYINDLADCQQRADEACAAWGLRAPAALANESVLRYRKRLLRQHQKYSEQFRDINLDDLQSGPLMDTVESKIYQDSVAKSAHPDVPEHRLRMISKHDGLHIVNTFHGSPSAWLDQAAGNHVRRYCTRINAKGFPES